jgi:cytochrome bd-type quinol oxidase subunit 2
VKNPLSAVVAILVGVVVLLGYFISLPQLVNLRELLLGWAIILAGAAALVGIINLLSVHWRKLRSPKGGSFYSLMVILSFAAVFGLGLWLGPDNATFQKVVTAIQVPVEATLMAVLAVTLAVASVRLFRRRMTAFSVIFLISALVFLVLGAGILPVEGVPVLGSVAGFIARLPLAGARGILLGVALGSLTTGLRILLGADRPYGG